MMRKLLAAMMVTTFCLCFAVVDARAATARVRDGKLAIIHADGRVQNGTFDAAKDSFLLLRNQMEWEFDQDEVVTIVIEDPNPFLYVYTFRGTVKTPTEEFVSVQKFGESLKLFSAGLTAVAKTPTGDAMDAFQNAIGVGPVPNLAIPQSTPSAPSETFTLPVAALRAITAQAIQAERSYQESDRAADSENNNDVLVCAKEYLGIDNSIQRLGFHAYGLSQRLAKVPEWIKLSATEPAEAKKQILEQRDPEMVAQIDAGFDTINKVMAKYMELVRNAEANNKLEIRCSDPAISKLLASNAIKALEQSASLTYISFAKHREAEIRSLTAKWTSFVDTASRINKPITLGTISYSATENSSTTINIAPNDENATLARVSNRPTGDFTFIVRPLTPVHIAVGPAAIYNFTEKKKFTVAKVGEELKIAREDDGGEVYGGTIGAMLTLTPRHWRSPIFGGSFQIGVSPAEGDLGLYGGVGFSLYRRLFFGGGVVYQQVEKLANGFSEGQTVSAPQDLKTTSAFKPGFYLTLNLNFGIR